MSDNGVSGTERLGDLNFILFDRPAGRNIIGHAVDTINRLRTENVRLRTERDEARAEYSACCAVLAREDHLRGIAERERDEARNSLSVFLDAGMTHDAESCNLGSLCPWCEIELLRAERDEARAEVERLKAYSMKMREGWIKRDALLMKLDEALADPGLIAIHISNVGGFCSGLNLIETDEQIIDRAIQRIAVLVSENGRLRERMTPIRKMAMPIELPDDEED